MDHAYSAINRGPRSDGRDLELLDRMGALYVAVVSDCLDQIGIRQNVMAPRIRPLRQDSRLAGYAATVRLEQVDEAPSDRADWYRGEINALESLQAGDVMVCSTCAGSYWGELLATASHHRGARGVVADAFTRDTVALMQMDFPTFVAGISAQDSLGRTDVVAFDVNVECGGVLVRPGDLILADHDGIVVTPADRATEVIERAEQKVAVEREMRASLQKGTPLSDAFATYGIL